MYQRVFAPMMGAKTDEARVTELAKVLDGKMAAYEAILSKQKYLAGDELTLADLFHLPHGVFLAPQKFNFLEDEDRFPHVARCALPCLLTPTRADIQNPIVGGRNSFLVRRGRQSRRAFRRRVQASSCRSVQIS
jgi:glutathione S-transferase